MSEMESGHKSSRAGKSAHGLGQCGGGRVGLGRPTLSHLAHGLVCPAHTVSK